MPKEIESIVRTEEKGVTWGPIPSRGLSSIAFALPVVQFRNGARSPKKTFRLGASSLIQPSVQLAASVFVSWLILNIFADFGPMKYNASNGVRYEHSDWALQGTNIVQLTLLALTVTLSSFLKFSFFLVIYKKKVLKFGIGFFVLLAAAVLLIWAVTIGDLAFVNLEYSLFITSSLHFSVSLVILSSVLFIGVDSFRVIKVKPGNEGSI
jgi:hypothetical protein